MPIPNDRRVGTDGIAVSFEVGGTGVVSISSRIEGRNERTCMPNVILHDSDPPRVSEQHKLSILTVIEHDQ